MLTVETTALEGLLILTPRRFGDARGFFAETWNAARLAEVTNIEPVPTRFGIGRWSIGICR